MNSRDIEVEIPRPRGMALDKRTVSSSDGFMTATDCVLSAAQVNDYLGKEIPDCEKLGLKADTIYRVYRDAGELKKAVPLFNGIPLLIDHSAINASNLAQQLVVGTVSECRWDNGRVMGTVSVWLDSAIQDIESELRRDLSAGYHFSPVVESGSVNGERYEIRMTAIRPQHMALVRQGRVSGATVADALPYHVAMERLCPGYGRLR